MPKKRAPYYTQTKPGYVHPSLQRTASASASTSAPQSVNERIQQLRREQAPRTTAQHRDALVEVVNKRTIPKELRQLLQMPEVDSPRPKSGTRSRAPRAGPRPPPGPAAPGSWLQRSRHAEDYLRNITKYKHGEAHRPQQLSALAKRHYTEYRCLPPTRSLVHQCLKTFAADWHELIEYEQYYVPALPESLKEILLSYLTIYGAEGALDRESFKTLFAKDSEIPGGSGSELVRFLDLTGLLNPGYTLTDLTKSLNPARPSKTTLSGALEKHSLDTPKAKEPQQHPSDIAEDWEDEADSSSSHDPEQPPLSIPSIPTLRTPHFPHLTRLSLAYPGAAASWADLLTLSKHLKTLTHLSLAHWPLPSTTPNATTTSMVSKHASPIALGASHFYSELDGDWHEAANILRRLSLNTYCLQWLDLEGCTWLKALTWDYPAEPDASASATREDRSYDPAWVRPSAQAGPDWNDAWRQLEYVNLYQGWIPSSASDLIAMPSGRIQMGLLSWLRAHAHEPEQMGKVRHGAGAHEWVEREKVGEAVASEIRALRKGAGGKWCKFDFGWEPVRRGKIDLVAE